MPWFRNHYRCDRCHYEWSDEWSATCDDECPDCGARNMQATDSDDLTVIIDETEDGQFAVLRSPDTAEHGPDYEELAVFADRQAAQAFAASFPEASHEH